MPMERAPFGYLTDEPLLYMITLMLKCVTPEDFGAIPHSSRFSLLYMVRRPVGGLRAGSVTGDVLEGGIGEVLRWKICEAV